MLAEAEDGIWVDTLEPQELSKSHVRNKHGLWMGEPPVEKPTTIREGDKLYLPVDPGASLRGNGRSFTIPGEHISCPEKPYCVPDGARLHLSLDRFDATRPRPVGTFTTLIIMKP